MFSAYDESSQTIQPLLADIPMFRTSLTFLLLWIASFSMAEAENWPRFRGPNGTGISTAKTIPVEWDDNSIRWRVPLAGEGNSSPIVWEDQLFLTVADEEKKLRSLISFSTQSGQELWRREVPFETYRKHKNNSFASSTPAVDDRHVYVLWHSREGSPLMAFTHAGEKTWEVDLGQWKQGQGGASSPIVHGEAVYVSHDHQENSALYALDRRNGRELWKVPRKGERACFSTPCVYAASDRQTEIVFTHCYEGIAGFDPLTGRQNWQLDVFGTSPQRAVGSPVTFEEIVIGSSGAAGGRRNVVAVRPLAEIQENITAEEAYRVFKSAPHVPTPLVADGRLYLWEDKGVVSAYDARTGETLWQKRAGGTYFASPVMIAGKLYNIDVTGKVFVLSSDGEILARNQLPEGGRASMAVGDETLFIRTDAALYAIGETP